MTRTSRWLAALAARCDKYARLLVSVAMRSVGARREAEDLLPDAFLEGWRSAVDHDPARAGFVPGWPSARALDRQTFARVATGSRLGGDHPAIARLASDVGLDGGPDQHRGRAALGELRLRLP